MDFSFRSFCLVSDSYAYTLASLSLMFFLNDVGAGSVAAALNVLVTNPMWVVSTRMMANSATLPTTDKPEETKVQVADRGSAIALATERKEEEEEGHKGRGGNGEGKQASQGVPQRRHTRGSNHRSDFHHLNQMSLQDNGHGIEKGTNEACSTRSESEKDRVPRRRLSIWQVVRLIWREENGLKGFYRGVVPSLLLISNPAVQFAVYERLIKLCKRTLGANSKTFSGPLPDLSSWQYFIIAAIAKAAATVLSYPFQVKRKHQGERGKGKELRIDRIFLKKKKGDKGVKQ